MLRQFRKASEFHQLVVWIIYCNDLLLLSSWYIWQENCNQSAFLIIHTQPLFPPSPPILFACCLFRFNDEFISRHVKNSIVSWSSAIMLHSQSNRGRHLKAHQCARSAQHQNGGNAHLSPCPRMPTGAIFITTPFMWQHIIRANAYVTTFLYACRTI